MSADTNEEPDVLEAAAARRRALAEQFARRPFETLVGVVSPGSGGGWQTDAGWTLSITLDSWKTPPGPMKSRPLQIELTTTREQFDILRDQIDTYSVARFRARVVEDSIIGIPKAEAVEYLGVDDSDPELNRASQELQKPVIHRDPEFGDLTLDRSVNWYSGDTEWNGVEIKLNLKLEEAADLEPALGAARKLWSDQPGWTQRVNEFAVKELLSLKNESWLDDGDAELTAEMFLDRMTLESITIGPDGDFDFWHDDGDLFWGHSIQVGGSLDGGLKHADIPG